MRASLAGLEIGVIGDGAHRVQQAELDAGAALRAGGELLAGQQHGIMRGTVRGVSDRIQAGRGHALAGFEDRFRHGIREL